jgi:ABC-type spermidine/putrescine transport system permease subunit I
VAAWQLTFFAAPLAFLVVITFWKVENYQLSPAFVLDNWERVLDSTPFQRALLYTLRVAGTTTVLGLLLAFPAAYIIALRLSPRMRDLAVAALIVPVFSSYIVRVYAWQVLLSPQGAINVALTGLGLPPQALLGNAFALQVGLLTLTLPVAVLILVFALSAIDRTLIEAAENLGCPPHRVIFNVLIPAVRPAILLAGTTIFLLSFSDYPSPVFLGSSRPPTLAILIVDTVKSGSQWPRASVIGVAMLSILALAFVLTQLLSRGRR